MLKEHAMSDALGHIGRLADLLVMCVIMNSRLFTQLTGGDKRRNGQYDYSPVARWTACAQIGGVILEDFVR